MITLTLPFPPALNNLYANGKRGRYVVERYATWRQVANTEINNQRKTWPVTGINGPVEITMTLGKPDRRKRDIDNLTKAPLDTLVKSQVIEDDSLVESLTIRWGDVTGAVIEVRPYDAA